MKHPILLLWGLTFGCGSPSQSEKAPAQLQPQIADEPTRGSPTKSNPLRQGFTQRPAPDTPGLPPSIAPFLTDAELDSAVVFRSQLDEHDVVAAQHELKTFVDAFEKDPSTASLHAVSETARELTTRGRILHVGVAELYADYLFPEPEDEANAIYQGKLAVFSGTVAPANMRDFADGFKLVEQNPYVHDPLLLATDYELSFVECRLAAADFQPLRDWQPIHFLAQVRGKKSSDVLLDRCIILP